MRSGESLLPKWVREKIFLMAFEFQNFGEGIVDLEERTFIMSLQRPLREAGPGCLHSVLQRLPQRLARGEAVRQCLLSEGMSTYLGLAPLEA